MSKRLDIAVAQLKCLREELETRKIAAAKDLAELERTPEFAALKDSKEAQKLAEDAVSAQEDLVKTLTMEEFEQTGEKRPNPNVLVKLFKVFAPYDRKKIEEWARQHAPAVFKFDVKSFEKVAIELGAPVKQIEEPRATISSKLE